MIHAWLAHHWFMLIQEKRRSSWHSHLLWCFIYASQSLQIAEVNGPALGLTLWKSADLLDANLDRSALSLPARRRNNSSVCCEWGTPCNPLMEICYLGYAIWEMHILTDGVWDGCCSQSKTQVDVIFGWGILKDENGQKNKGSLRNEDAWDPLFWIIVPDGILKCCEWVGNQVLTPPI